MKYRTILKKKAVKDLHQVPLPDRRMIIERIEALEDNLKGDVKKLTNHTPEYRMRYGNWRVLFEIVEEEIIIYRVMPRKEAYR